MALIYGALLVIGIALFILLVITFGQFISFSLGYADLYTNLPEVFRQDSFWGWVLGILALIIVATALRFAITGLNAILAIIVGGIVGAVGSLFASKGSRGAVVLGGIGISYITIAAAWLILSFVFANIFVNWTTANYSEITDYFIVGTPFIVFTTGFAILSIVFPTQLFTSSNKD